MSDSAPDPILHRVIHRADYRPPAFLVDTVDLTFELDPGATLVRAHLHIRRNPASGEVDAPLRLDGETLTLVSLTLDGEPLSSNRFTIQPDGALVVANPPDDFTLDVETRLSPESNTELSGLYVSGGAFFTQCEAEGFRRITFFPDHPDVMARYTTTIIADRARYPVLLSNGNPAEQGDMDGGRHFARWIDPHPKPSYLFAVVAGDLASVSDHFTTRSGRDVALSIWVRRGDEDRCDHAMRALKTSMAWDEAVYGLEYDLDVFNIAAVSDFNMGAMENKGLNVFNTKYVLAKPDTATDLDYQGIETVIAHEYFHNWTGNRVTCRDWFQLSLKEGLTVFRDQQFTADQGSAAVKRLHDVRALRAGQFPEDAGPLAHPVRPDSYIAIDNFYTATVYQKGAEIVRMMHTLLGPAGFRKGMDTYITRHDNQAVTIEDFVNALQDGSGIPLRAFLGWYAQAGTPELAVQDKYDPATRRYTISFTQQTRPTADQPEKHPVPIPVVLGLLDPGGGELPTRLDGEASEHTPGTRTLVVTEAQQDFVFVDVPAAPTPSLLRGFSAPVRLSGIGPDRLRFLAAHDTDPFVRWESGQQYATQLILRLIAEGHGAAALVLDPGLLEAKRATLLTSDTDPAFAAEVLALPSEAYLADQMEVVDVDAIHALREGLRRALGQSLHAELSAAYDRLADPGPYSITGAAIGRRALRNACLGYLAAASDSGVVLAKRQFDTASNMTDKLAALAALMATDRPERTQALSDFYAAWRDEELVMDKWFAIQAGSLRPQVLDDVRALYHHADFDLRKPNRVRALVGTFTSGNQVRFHDATGAGYRFLAEVIIALDPLNSQTAARLVGPLGTWRRHNSARADLMRAELNRILAMPRLSRGTYEKVSKALA